MDAACCALLSAYQTSPSGEAFEVALLTLCGNAHCRAIFHVVTEGAPFLLRQNHDDRGARAVDTFEHQCQAQDQSTCIIERGPFSAVTTPRSSTERSCLETLYVRSADLLENREDVEIDVDTECCKYANRYFRIQDHSSFLQTQLTLPDPACSDVVNRELQEIDRIAKETTFQLCGAGSCHESIERALFSQSEELVVPTDALCKEAEETFAFTCAGDDFRGAALQEGQGTPRPPRIQNVSEQCCVDSLHFFMGSDGLREFFRSGFRGLTTPVPMVLCSELACRKGFSELVGSALIHDICVDIDASQQQQRMASFGDQGSRRQVLQVELDAGTCGGLTCAAETACRYGATCYGGAFCTDGIAKDDGQVCALDAVGTGICLYGECVTNSACVEYPAGGICSNYGVSGQVYIKPTPLSFFQAEGDTSVDGRDVEDDTVQYLKDRLALLDSLMDAHVALAGIMLQECRVAHLEYACATTYPACEDVKEPRYSAAVARVFQALPRPMCYRDCERRSASCAASDALLVTAFDIPPNFPDCASDVYGAERVEETSSLYVSAFEGQRVYPEKSLSIFIDETNSSSNSIDGSNPEENVLRTLEEYINCEDTSAQFVEYKVSCQAKLASEWGTLSALDITCEYPQEQVPGEVPGTCQLPCIPLYADEELRSMWHTYVIPGVIGFGLCLLQLVLVVAGGRRRWKAEPFFVHVTCFLGVMYGIAGILPTLFLYTKLPCPDTISARSDTVACRLNRVSVVFLLSMYYWIAFHMISLHVHVVNGGFSARGKSVFFKVSRIISWGVPAICAVTILVFGSPEAYTEFGSRSWDWSNPVQDMFLCSPNFPSFWVEFVTVHLHFLLCSVAIAITLFSVAKSIFVLSRYHRDRAGHQHARDEPPKLQTRIRIFLSSSSRVLAVAISMTALFALHLAITIVVTPRWEDYADSSSEWFDCKQFEGPCLDLEESLGLDVDQCDQFSACGDYPDDLPTTSQLALLYFSQSFVLFVVGATFAITLNNCNALKDLGSRLFGTTVKLLHKRKGSSERSSTESSRMLSFDNPLNSGTCSGSFSR